MDRMIAFFVVLTAFMLAATYVLIEQYVTLFRKGMPPES